MNKKSVWAVSILWGIVLLSVPLWILSYPETTFRNTASPWLIYAAQLSGLLGFSLYALSLMLATRLSWLEDLFDGLDKVYHVHHTIGKAAFAFLLIHPLLLALRWVPHDIEKALWYIFPLHRKTEINLGSWALWGLVLLMLFTLISRMPYDKWKITHKFMGLFFIFGILHVFLLDDLIFENLPLAIYLVSLSVLGAVSWLYKSVFLELEISKYHYTVEQVERLNEKIMQISLRPIDEELSFLPGQFCFFSFRDEALSREGHPYTICSAPEQQTITITVKALGDYTNRLYRELRPGVPALIEGAYGRFDYRQCSYPQIWIAGGVGIAPFISWANALQNTQPPPEFDAELYYCVNSRADAVYLQTFETLEQQLPGFSVHLTCAEQEGFLKADDIPGVRDKKIFICGPKEMRQALLKGFDKLQVPRKNILFEDFDFF
jgi:predicted ferric reductase